MSRLYALYSSLAWSNTFFKAALPSTAFITSASMASVTSSPKFSASSPLFSARSAAKYMVNVRLTASPLPTYGCASLRILMTFLMFAPSLLSMMYSLRPSARVISLRMGAPFSMDCCTMCIRWSYWRRYISIWEPLSWSMYLARRSKPAKRSTNMVSNESPVAAALIFSNIVLFLATNLSVVLPRRSISGLAYVGFLENKIPAACPTGSMSAPTTTETVSKSPKST